MTEPTTAACIRCGGTDDLRDRGMAPGMTYCAPCRKAMSQPDTAAPWECGRCGEKFAAREVAQRHADQCDRPAMRVVAGITPDSARTVRRD